jgi:hypothetical protein
VTPLVLLLLTAAQAAPAAATWRIEGAPGAVRAIAGTVRTGGRIVADGFVDDAESVRRERAALADPRAPAGSCDRAAGARPFTRLRRFAADGRLLWAWRVSDEEQALRLLAGTPGDCLSPDGGRLLVVSHRLAPGEPVYELGVAVVAVDHDPRFVEAKGRRTGEAPGILRRLSTLAWRRGGEATLDFTIHDPATGAERRDEAVLGRQR